MKNGSELQALKVIKLDCDFQFEDEHEKEFAIIEKTLKAVDIIRKKKVDLDYLLKGLPNLESYNEDRVPGHQLTEEEHDLIYDVFTESISAESWLGAMAELNDPDLPKGE